MELLAEALLHHPAFPLATALRRALWARGEDVPDEEEERLWDYTDRLLIERTWTGFHCVTRDEEPLVCWGRRRCSRIEPAGACAPAAPSGTAPTRAASGSGSAGRPLPSRRVAWAAAALAGWGRGVDALRVDLGAAAEAPGVPHARGSALVSGGGASAVGPTWGTRADARPPCSRPAGRGG